MGACSSEKSISSTNINPCFLAHPQHPLIFTNRRESYFEEREGWYCTICDCMKIIKISYRGFDDDDSDINEHLRPLDEPSYYCRTCKIDLCQECYDYIKGRKFHNPHKHELVGTKRKCTWACDICRTESWEGTSWCCEECDFDLCINCAFKKR